MLVVITNKNLNRKFMAEFDTKTECENWVKNHKIKGKDILIKKSNVKEIGYKVILEEIKDNGEVEYILEGSSEYIVEYIENNPVTVEEHLQAFDKKIKEILKETDWTQLSDVPISTEKRMIYKKYREYVRNKKNDYKDENIHQWKILSFKEYKDMKFPK